MISTMGMIHMIRLDHPQYFLCKFTDDTVRAGMPSLGAPTGAPSSVIFRATLTSTKTSTFSYLHDSLKKMQIVP